MFTLIVLLFAAYGLWVSRQWLARRLSSVPVTPVAQNAVKAASVTMLIIFFFIFGYAANFAPDAWDLPLGIVSLFFFAVGAVRAYRELDNWRKKHFRIR